MKKFNDIKMKPKLILLLLSCGLIPSIILGVYSIKLATDALMKSSFNQLSSVRGLKEAEVEKYFTKTEHDLEVLVDTVTVLQEQAFKTLEAAHDNKIKSIQDFFHNNIQNINLLSHSSDIKNLFQALEKQGQLSDTLGKTSFDTESNQYHSITAKPDAYLKNFKKNSRCRNILLIDAKYGQVIYSTLKEKDLGTNLKTGPYSNSGLAKIWKKTLKNKNDALVDFTPYEPAQGEPVMFLGTPVMSGSKALGVLVTELSVAPLNEIMHERAGLGQTGETYIVGQDHLLRTDSSLHRESFNVKKSFAEPDKYKVDIESVKLALSGKDSADLVTGYNGNTALSTFTSIKIMDLTWAVIAEIDAEEAYSPKDDQGNEFYKSYIKKYGFYDLFLIHSSGYCFYTATKESDYQTNFVNGKFSNSNLGSLVKKVNNSRKLGLADFAPYAPSNNEPAAFIAKPVIHPMDNEVEIVIALQLPLNGINEIMQNREGMGETGESYLIGPDKLMRSDSFLDPINRTVKASFAGNIQNNGVDTESGRAALSGETGSKTIIDYNGNQVLSSYAPVHIGDTTWALLTEIDKTEVKKPITSLMLSIIIISGVIILLITSLALYIAKQISTPIINSVKFAETISRNDLTSKLEIKQQDEIGDLANALNEMSSSLSSIIEEIDNGVGTLSSSATEMATIAEQMTLG
ncbi:MAG: cache and HAMP domain-containing protein, partial [Desulfobulbaceae bacterium]|nr:cache and HAMP domain-containing protein [Desulfobulbaceae bacterium]